MESKQLENALVWLGGFFQFRDQEQWEAPMALAQAKNAWFTFENQQTMFQSWADALVPEKVLFWLKSFPSFKGEMKKVGIIAAGNVPMVGFHDVLCVIASGHQAHVKLSSADDVLIPFVMKHWIAAFPELNTYFEVVERIQKPEALIATGSNNSARNFEYYFRNIPHIIRHNRNGIGVISNEDTPDEIALLGEDVFRYFGLGCRNISFVFLPQKYPIAQFYEPIENWKYINDHNKYANNYTYNKALILMNMEPVFDNGFLLLREQNTLVSPLGMLYYKYYETQEEIVQFVEENQEQIQTLVVQNKELACRLEKYNPIPFGSSQQTGLFDYADGVNIPNWLKSIE